MSETTLKDRCSDNNTHKSAFERMTKGEIVEMNNKLYGICSECGSLVRIDKPIFGSIHLCK